METSIERKQSLWLIWCAITFYAISAASFIVILARFVYGALTSKPVSISEIIPILIVAGLATGFGYVLTRIVGNKDSTASEKILTPAIRELLGDAIHKSADPVTEITRLIGLIGGTGVFRKLELTGMPLATILMTLAFCLLGILTPALATYGIPKPDNIQALSNAFIDMAKLTLGAFIGSFVTKSSSRDSESARAGAAEAAKTIAVKARQDASDTKDTKGLAGTTGSLGAGGGLGNLGTAGSTGGTSIPPSSSTSI